VARRTKRAYEAAYNTCDLIDTMLMVTDDGSYQGWPSGRHLSQAYGALLQALETSPPPPRSPAEQAAIDQATKVLYETDPDGLEMKTALYRTYQRNATAYATAKATFATAAAKAIADPVAADTWPMVSAPLQQAVDDAWDTWKSQGADKVEAALATIQSLGIPLEQGLIAKARKIHDVWQLGLAGVPVKVAYSSIMPRAWADPEADDIGFTKLAVSSGEYHSHHENHQLSVSTGAWSANSSESSGEGGLSIFGFGLVGGGGTGSSDSSGRIRSDSWGNFKFRNDARNLSITLEYGLCQIRRPWLLSDLFYMRNYWVKGNKAGAISDGTLENQVGKSDPPLIPMYPTHFLVLRNVEISSSNWGQDGETLSHVFSENADSSRFWSTSVGGGAALAIGPLVFGGKGSHKEAHFSASRSSTHGQDDRSTYGVSFENGTLKIKGAQIVAWLSELLPKSPPLDDPDLPTDATAGTTGPGR
jgi:hypothetical protein